MGGHADFLIPCVAARGHSVITSLANLAPNAILRTYRLGVTALQDPSKQLTLLAEAQALQCVIANGNRAITVAGVAGTKFLLQKTFGYGGTPRNPLLPLEHVEEIALWNHPDVVAPVRLEADIAQCLLTGL